MSDLNQIISLRLSESDRMVVQLIASRFLVRESDIYRLAIHYLLNSVIDLADESCIGSDLLPALLDVRQEIYSVLSLKKHHLNKMINGHNPSPEKYVDMVDIELLLLPPSRLKQQLCHIVDPYVLGKMNIEQCLRNYLIKKYKLTVYCDF